MFRGTKAYPPEAYQAHPDESRRAAERLHDRRLHELPHDVREGGPRDDPEGRGRPLPEPRVLRARRSRPSRAPSSASTTRTAPTRSRSSSRCSARTRSRSHTYQHTTMGFLKDIEDMPNQFEYSKTFFDRWYRPEYATVIVAGDVTAAEVLPLVEKYWGGWKPGRYKVEIPQEPPPAGPVRAHVAWTAPTLPWVSVAFHGPAFAETSREWAALDILSDLDFGPTSDVYKKLVVDEQKVDRLFGGAPDNADPELFGVVARVKKAEDVPYVRDEILKAFAAAAAAPPSAAARRRREVGRPLRVPADARQHRDDRRQPRALRALPPLVRDAQRGLPDVHAGDAGRHPGRGAEVLRRRRPRPDDAVEGPAAGGDRDPARDRVAEAGGGRGRGGRRRGPRRRSGRGRQRSRRGDEAPRPALEAASAQREAALQRRRGPRPRRQGGPRRSRRRDDRRRRLAGDDDRPDREGALPDGGELRRARRQGDDDLHRARPPRQLGPFRRHRPPAALRARLPRRGLQARSGTSR